MRYYYRATLAAVVLLITACVAWAAPAVGAVELTADVIEFDAPQSVMTAQGNVTLKRDGMTMTAPQLTYNTKTREAAATGGVRAVQDKTTMTAAEVRSYDNARIVARGSAVIHSGDKTLRGAVVEYFTDREFGILPQGGVLQTADGTLTGDYMEAYIDSEKAIAKGNVHLVSPQRNLDATGNLAEYFGAKQGRSQIILTGNVRAVQEGNVLTGNRVVLYLDDQIMDASGRPKLIINPKQ